MIKGVLAKSASVHAREISKRTGNEKGRRTIRENRIAPPIDLNATFGQLEREENGQQRQHRACLQPRY